ncbi:MAG: hypothetical protein ACEPO8_00090 [Rhodothermaceae bacterium]
MNPVLKKLRFQEQNPVLILNSPKEFKEIEKEINSKIETDLSVKSEFILGFYKSIAEAEKDTEKIVKALEGDGYLWFCYPKGTSKKYKSDLNRTTVLQLFAPFDFEGVTQVAVDEDWSAMRVRYVDNIKVMKRKTAMSEKGKERIKKQ